MFILVSELDFFSWIDEPKQEQYLFPLIAIPPCSYPG